MVELGFVPETLCHDVRDNVRRAPTVQEAGFDAIWEGDHTLPWHHKNGHSASVIVALEGYLQNTDTITVGGMVIPAIGIRRQPVDLALDMATMAVLHPGRVALCVGAGEAMNEKTATGFWPPARERVERTVESIELIRKVWDSDDYFHHKGKYFDTFFYLYSKPEEPIPLYCSANGPVMARHAGQLTEGHVAVGVPPAHYQDVLLPAFEEGAREAGRELNTLTRFAWVSTAFHPDRQKARQAAREYGGLLIPECYHHIQDPRVIDQRAALISDEALETAFCVATTPEEVVESFDRFVEAGCNHIIWADMSPDPDLALDACAKEIVPALRERWVGREH